VYNTCLMGVLRNKTRVLVTNQLQFVSGANSVVFMQDGKIQEKGTYDELMKSGQGFAQLMSSAEVGFFVLVANLFPADQRQSVSVSVAVEVL